MDVWFTHRISSFLANSSVFTSDDKSTNHLCDYLVTAVKSAIKLVSE